MSATSQKTGPAIPSGDHPGGLASLPRAGLREVLGGIVPLFRPGAERSPLRALGERFVVDIPGRPPLLITSSPADAKALLSEHDGALSFGELLTRFTPHPVLFGGDNFIFLEGADHLRERRRIAPAFHGEVLKAYEGAVAAIAERRLESWPLDTPVEFLALGKQLALDVMMTVIFGVSQRERMARLECAMLDYCAATESPLFLGLGVLAVTLGRRWGNLPRLDRTAAAVDAIVLEEIAERRARPDDRPDDCLSMFLEINEAEARPKSDLALAAEMRGLMLAGYETTAVTLAWVAETLVHHPAALERLHQSVDRGESAYLDAVIAEVMRLRPAFPATGRGVLREFELAGVRVPRKATIVISIMALHERPELYSEPLRFQPERFLEERPGTYTWLPFGGGTHRCLGGAFALFEARVLLRTLLQRRTLESVSPAREAPSRTHPMLVPGAGARVRLAARG